MNDTDALLAELHGLEVPGVSGAPAAGWWFVLLAFAASLALVWFMVRRYRQQRWIRDAKRELDAIRHQANETDSREFLSALSQLLRRVLIKCESRATVAALQGDAWLARLDAVHGDTVFRSELGPLLSEGPYRRSTLMTREDQERLIEASATVIRRAGKFDA